MMNIRKYSVLVALMMIVTCGQSAASRLEENEKPGDKSLPSDILSYGKDARGKKERLCIYRRRQTERIREIGCFLWETCWFLMGNLATLHEKVCNFLIF
ncbi:MAG: hypothetical protein U0K26_06130 [Prevotella pectinovora]|uniref:hypothetical protein n=1 Tax=Prevotella pectinovora TaxID=1602169 RepID=UPI002E798600|nr:hypothetical protein [Prevotella pectinovora]MEE1546805.1 hypothetical protein [Prevotella pectinovora]